MPATTAVARPQSSWHTSLPPLQLPRISRPAGGVPGQTVAVTARDGEVRSFRALVRIDTAVELDYYRNGGILHTVLRTLAAGGGGDR